MRRALKVAGSILGGLTALVLLVAIGGYLYFAHGPGKEAIRAKVVEAVNGGVLFSNTDELVEGMRRLHQDPALRDTLATNAYRDSRKRWFEDAVMDRFLELIETARAAKRDGRVKRV